MCLGIKAIFLTEIVFTFLLINNISSVPWLSFGKDIPQNDLVINSPRQCNTIQSFTKKQIRFCKKNFESMNSIAKGASEAYHECQYQFQKRRWNCTMIDATSKETYLDGILNTGIRETAFVHAISAAGVAYRITRDCSKGLMDRCGCDLSSKGTEPEYINNSLPKSGNKPNIQNYNWKGCSDNVQYGIGVSKDFVDGAEKGRNISTNQIIMNLHNNRAGRQVLMDNMKKMCKCHGVSGSCEMKTCWQSLPPFRIIGSIIKEKFDGATEVKVAKEENKFRLLRKNPMYKRHTNADLVYIQPSPDFCQSQPEKGVFGTSGRICNITSQSVDGCDLLCCNRGYDRKIEVKEEMCNCKFHFCCKVECQKCKKTREIYTCR